MSRVLGIILVCSILFPTVVCSQSGPSNHISRGPNPSVPKGKRVALVIGNSNYNQSRLRLKNPTNDAEKMADALVKLGFEVTLKVNVGTKEEMLKLINEWIATIPADGVALFYYAGHGAEVDGNNYLFPVLATIPEKGNGKQIGKEAVGRQAVDLSEELLKPISSRNDHLSIVILDACRANLRSPDLQVQGLTAVTGLRGTYIAYATAPGSFASDGSGDHGLFTDHLLKNIESPGLKIEDMFKRVRCDVISDKTNVIGQLPWDASSMLTDFYFDGSGRPPIPPKAAIRITTIPIYKPEGDPGDPSATIEGDTLGVDPEDFQVMLYSWTDKWYVQPTQGNPFTEIGPDGKWSKLIHPGAVYAAVLVKRESKLKPENTIVTLPAVGNGIVAVTKVEGRKN